MGERGEPEPRKGRGEGAGIEAPRSLGAPISLEHLVRDSAFRSAEPNSVPLRLLPTSPQRCAFDLSGQRGLRSPFQRLARNLPAPARERRGRGVEFFPQLLDVNHGSVSSPFWECLLLYHNFAAHGDNL